MYIAAHFIRMRSPDIEDRNPQFNAIPLWRSGRQGGILAYHLRQLLGVLDEKNRANTSFAQVWRDRFERVCNASHQRTISCRAWLLKAQAALLSGSLKMKAAQWCREKQIERR